MHGNGGKLFNSKPNGMAYWALLAFLPVVNYCPLAIVALKELCLNFHAYQWCIMVRR